MIAEKMTRPFVPHIEPHKKDQTSPEKNCKVYRLETAIRSIMDRMGIQRKPFLVSSPHKSQIILFRRREFFVAAGGMRAPFLSLESGAPLVYIPPFCVAGVENLRERYEPVGIIDGDDIAASTLHGDGLRERGPRCRDDALPKPLTYFQELGHGFY